MVVLLVLALGSLLTLSALKLHYSYKLMERRTTLFLCTKEMKGELHRYLVFMGRTNWAIRNTERAKLVMAFIPGLQGGALKAEKLKRALIHAQNVSLIPYVKKIKDLQQKGCPIDPRMLLTPFELSKFTYARDDSRAARLRKNQWSYQLVKLPYSLEVSVNADAWEGLNPHIQYRSSEKLATLSFPLFSPY